MHIQLYDVVRTTGEVVDVFRFTYKQRDYRTLSLSEKILAGIEVAAMMRRITGIDLSYLYRQHRKHRRFQCSAHALSNPAAALTRAGR